MEIFPRVIENLKECGKYVATMESCTGGALASEITNYSGASEVLKFSAVTYSNEYKINMGVSSEVIDEYSVYSMETAVEMASSISKFADSDYGIGITGKINTPDPANNFGADDIIYVAIFDRENELYYRFEINALPNKARKENKENIVNFIGRVFLNILNNGKIFTCDGEHDWHPTMNMGDKLVSTCNKCGCLDVISMTLDGNTLSLNNKEG